MFVCFIRVRLSQLVAAGAFCLGRLSLLLDHPSWVVETKANHSLSSCGSTLKQQIFLILGVRRALVSKPCLVAFPPLTAATAFGFAVIRFRALFWRLHSPLLCCFWWQLWIFDLGEAACFPHPLLL